MMPDPVFTGKTILIGLTFCEADGTVAKQEQRFGTIKSFDENNGFEIELDDGETQWLPPDTSAVRPADPGKYRLKTSGRVIVDPDYLCTYTITKPKH